MIYSQQSLDLILKKTLEFKKPLFYRNERVSCGKISQLALESGNWSFTVTPYKDKIYKLVHDSCISFLAELKEINGKIEYEIKSCVENIKVTNSPPYEGLNINGIGETGDSQALWIAKKMQMSPQLIQQAQEYMNKKEYQTQKRIFKQKAITDPFLEEEQPKFSKGDSVLLTETQQKALVYEDDGSEQLTVFFDKEVSKVLKKRVKRLMTAEELYPLDYDLDALFVDFKTRKLEKDLVRGSKKALKQIDKEAKLRRKQQETKE